MRNLTVTTNSDTVGTQIKDNTISIDNGTSTYSETCCIDVASTITTYGVSLHRQELVLIHGQEEHASSPVRW